METKSDIFIEHLAKAIENLPVTEKLKLFDLLSEDLEIKNTSINIFQKKALDKANEKEESGKSVFHSWKDTKHFIKSRGEK